MDLHPSGHDEDGGAWKPEGMSTPMMISLLWRLAAAFGGNPLGHLMSGSSLDAAEIYEVPEIS